MANCPRGHDHQSRATVPNDSEPATRRWPHPVNWTETASLNDPELRYIHCALSYQNQVLADIKTLLQELLTAQEESGNPSQTQSAPSAP